MKRSRFSEEQIICVLREQEAGVKVAEVCRKHGISEPTFYAWKALEQSIESNTHSISALAAPLAVPQGVWFAGFVVFLAVASVYLLRAMLAFAKGDLRRVRELLGARSIEEEMEFEKESLGLAPRGDR